MLSITYQVNTLIESVELEDVLSKHAQTINSDAVIYADFIGKAGDKRSSSQLSVGELLAPKSPALYSTADREKFWPNAVETLAQKISGASPQTTLNPAIIYCCRSGQPISRMDNRALSQALQFHGEAKFLEYLSLTNGTQVHPLWLQCDPQSLDRLMQIDPLGYAIYCLNLLTAKYLNKLHKKEDLAAHHWSIARAYQWLTLLSPENLSDTCDNLCGTLSYGDEVARYVARHLDRKHGRFSRSPDYLASLAIEGKLNPLLNDATIEALLALGTYQKRYQAKLGTPKEAQRGPSQFKAQKKNKERLDLDETLARAIRDKVLDAFMQDNDEDLTTIFSDKPRKTDVKKAFAKLAEHSAMGKDKPTVQDSMLAALEGFDLESFDGGEDDNTIEMRAIPRETLPSAALIPDPVPVPKITIRELLEKQRAAQQTKQVTIPTPETPVKFDMRARLAAMKKKD